MSSRHRLLAAFGHPDPVVSDTLLGDAWRWDWDGPPMNPPISLPPAPSDERIALLIEDCVRELCGHRSVGVPLPIEDRPTLALSFL